MLGVFVISLSLLNWRRPRLLWLAALAASLLLPTALLTAAVAAHGPGFFWLNFWTNTAGRRFFVTLNMAAIAWMFFVLYAVQRASLDRCVLRALGNLFLAVGAVFVALGLVPALAGLEKTLTAINDKMAVLPLGLSRILGITIASGHSPGAAGLPDGGRRGVSGAWRPAPGRGVAYPTERRGMTRIGAGSRLWSAMLRRPSLKSLYAVPMDAELSWR